MLKQYSAMTEQVHGLSKLCDQCNQLGVCVVSAVNDVNCSLRWSATVSVVQESMWWKGQDPKQSRVPRRSRRNRSPPG